MSIQNVESVLRRRASDISSRSTGPLTYDGSKDWLDTLLEQVESLPHKSPTLQRVMNLFDGPITTHRYAYARFLDETLLAARDYARIVEQFGGVPTETEFRSVHRAAWAFIQGRSEHGETSFVVVIFDQSGIKFERKESTDEKALDIIVADGFVLLDEDALFRTSCENTWRGGAQSLAPVDVPVALSFRAVQHSGA